MATYKWFEELPAWRAAAELYDRVDDLLDRAPPRLRAAFRNQLERAALSVSNNIAEGFERGTTNELLAFLYIARGSAGEVRSMLLLASRRPYLAGLQSEFGALIALAESCSRQLRAWAAVLQDSPIAGPRHLNTKSRAAYERQKSRAAAGAEFQALLLQHLPPGHPLRPAPDGGRPESEI